MAIFWPALVRVKRVLGSPFINFLFLKVLKGRSIFRESGNWEYFGKLKVLGNRVKHSLTNLSKSHFPLPEITEYIENKIRSEIGTFISFFNSDTKNRFFQTIQKRLLGAFVAMY